MPQNLSKAEIARLEQVPIEIPSYNPVPGRRSTHPFNVSQNIQKYRPDELNKPASNQSRTLWFADQLRSITRQLSRPVPYAFRTSDGELRSLDAGCLGHLLKRPDSEFRARLDSDGFIDAIELTELAQSRAAQPAAVERELPVERGSTSDEERPTAFPNVDLPDFNPSLPPDERRRAESERTIREGASEFRRQQIAIWNGRCAVTRTSIRIVLDGAHIFPYLGEYTNDPRNGLLLRADVHRLFDAHLINITLDGQEIELYISRKLRNSNYWKLNFKRIHLPNSHSLARQYVEYHYQQFRQKSQAEGE